MKQKGFALMSLLILALFVVIAFVIYENVLLQKIINSTAPTASPIASPVLPTSNPKATPIWNTYTSPMVSDNVSPFQISYPPTWSTQEEFVSKEPRSLSFTLLGPKGETIKILQAMGGGGSCVYFDDSDYYSFNGMGVFFTTYTQLDKPALWRISKHKTPDSFSHTVCQRGSLRYIDTTQIGWVNLNNISSKASFNEAKMILETIVFKPTPTTKTLFN